MDGPGTPDGFLPGAPKEGFSVIPMWVADMNFNTFPGIVDAIVDRVKIAPMGYFKTRDEYFNAIINWQKKRNNSTVSKENIGYENGVLGCYAAMISVYTKPGDGIFVLNPCYVGFQRTIKNLKRVIIRSDLYRDENGIWRMNYEDIEKTIKENNIKVVTLCSPYNPIGRVWEKEELEKFYDIAKKYDCIVFSDEIWSDFILGDNKFIPSRDISEDAKMRTITACAPSKTFSLAGLIGSYHLIYNPEIKSKIDEYSLGTHYNSLNVLSQHALIAAYTPEGEVWVDELLEVIESNVDYAYDYFSTKVQGISLAKPQGTYMMYIDCTEYLKAHNMTIDELMKKGWDVGVTWQNGESFGLPNTIRLNLALPHSQLLEAFDRMTKYVF